jgi:proline iminopeptidase
VKRLLVFLAACGSSPHPSTTPMSTGDHTITVDGFTLAYHVRGKGPTCIVHSGGPGLQWSYLQMPEVESSMTLVYLEPPGTGASSGFPTPADYSPARYGELLDHFRAALGIDRACVLGHSYGGIVALHWATAHPDHVAGLILYDTTARSDADTQKLQGIGMSTYVQEPWYRAAQAAADREDKVKDDKEADEVLADELPLLFGDWTHHGDAYKQRLGQFHAYAKPMLGGAANSGNWDLRDKLASVRAPTLVIVGQRDWVTPIERTDEIVKGISGATRVVLANSGHMGHVEEPGAFAAAIQTFAAKLH